MKIVSRLSLSCMVAMFTMGTFTSQEVSARTQPAFLGSARYGTDQICFFEGNGGPMQKYCSGKRQWVSPLVLDNAVSDKLYVTVLARGAASGTHNVNCRAYALSLTDSFVYGTSDHTELNTGGLEHLELNVQVPAYGSAWVWCDLEQDTRVLTVKYDF